MTPPIAPQRSQSHQRGTWGSVKGAAANNPHSLEPRPQVGDERRVSTLLENGAIFCIRAVFQASCRLQDMNCSIGCALTKFPGFLGDSKVKIFSLVKKGKLRVPAPMTRGSGAPGFHHGSFFIFQAGHPLEPYMNIFVLLQVVAHTWEAALAGRGTEQSVIMGACGKVRHCIFLPSGATGYSHI